MPSAAYIKAASAAHREPVIHMAIESVSAIKRAVSTTTEWQAGTVSASLNTVEGPHEVRLDSTLALALDGNSPQGSYSAAFPFQAYLSWINRFSVRWVSPNSGDTLSGHVEVRLNSRTGTLLGQTGTLHLTGQRTGGFLGSVLRVATVEGVTLSPILFSAGQVAYLLFVPQGVDGADMTGTTVVISAVSGSLTTVSVDLGVVPSAPTVVSIDDTVPYGCAIAYTAEGRDDAGAGWNALGAIADGGTMAPYRYYRWSAAFTGNGSLGCRLREIAVSGGDSQYLHLSTHIDAPVAGARPYIVPGGVGTLGTKIDLMKPATTGELTVRLFWTKETADLLATGYLKNKAVLLRRGYVGLSESDFEPLLVGRWYDYDADPVKMELGVKLRDVRQVYQKRKLPVESYSSATGEKTTIPLSYPGWNVLSVVLDLYDKIGIPDRYIDRDAFEALIAGARSGADWNVTRTIATPEDADDLINELAVIAGVILSPQADGSITPIIYDENAEPAAVLDAREVKVSKYEGGQKELFTRSIVYHAPLTSSPGEEEENYAKAFLYYDQAAEAAWGESGEKRWFEKWNASTAAVQALAARMWSWYSTPRISLTVSDLPPRHAGLKLGQLVQIDNLLLPVPSAAWPGITAGRKFLIVSRDDDPKTGTLKLGLRETGTVGTPGAGVVGTDMVIGGTETPFGAVNIYTVAGGAGPYTWETTVGTLSATTGTSVTLDVSGLSGDGVLSVTDAGGKVTLRFRILPPMVEDVGYRHTDTGTILTWEPSAATIVEYEVRLLSAPAYGGLADSSGGSILTSGGEELLTSSGEETTDPEWDGGTRIWKGRTTELNVGFLAAGSWIYMVRAIDGWGNYSGAGTKLQVTVQRPSMLSVTPLVIDNNVNLYWVGLAGSYPIASYRVWRGATWAAASFIAEVNGTFQTVLERESGSYTYWVEPRDSAGNYGTPMPVSASVSQPPDYVLYADQDLDLSAVDLSSMVYDAGVIIGPFDTTQTWEEHFTDNSWDQPQDQIDAGYPVFLQPSAESGYIEKVTDFGGLIAGTMITATPTWRTVAGSPTLTPTLSVSADGEAWTGLGSVWAGRAESFRYVKTRITVTGADDTALAEVSRVNLRLDVKEISDAGRATAAAADADGTLVEFNKSFVDIISITVTPRHQAGIDGIVAVVNFVDGPNPTGFRVLLYKRSDGTRLNGDFDWYVRGI